MVKSGKENHSYKHGGSTLHPKEYRSWSHMKGRCYCKTDGKYPSYGARGIVVCEEWRNDFSAFLADMGKAPTPTHSIDRIDNDGNYEPSNCRWATAKEQSNNQRSNRIIEYDGRSQSLTEWSKEYGIKFATLSLRLDAYGMTIEEALTKPVLAHTRTSITFNGVTRSHRGWSKALGLSKNAVDERLRSGMTVEQALSKARFRAPNRKRTA